MTARAFAGFAPYVGSEYGNGIRIYVLGESHYGDADDLRESLTSEVVEYYTQQRPGKAHTRGMFPRVARLLLGRPARASISDDEYSAVWRRIVFSNFVQRLPGERPRMRPSPELWQTGAEPFQTIVRCLDPDVILVVGRATWDHLPPPVRVERVLLVGERTAPARWYDFAGRPAVAMYINHTASFGWSYAEWLPVVMALLRLPGGHSTFCQAQATQHFSSLDEQNRL